MRNENTSAVGTLVAIVVVGGLALCCFAFAGVVFWLLLADSPAVAPVAKPPQGVEPAGVSRDDSQPEIDQNPSAPDPQWQSLFDGHTLDGWEITNYGGEGDVYVEQGAIVMEMGSNMTGVTYTGEPPKSNYELELEGMRREGLDFFCTTTFPVGEEFCTFVVGGWSGGVVGLSNVDNKDASDNLTTRRDIFFDNGRWYQIRIRVTDAKVECWIDDQQVVDLARENHQFGTRPEVYLNKPLGIATWQTVGAVRDIRLRRLTKRQ